MKNLENNKVAVLSLVKDMNLLLANLHIYTQKLKNYHWNIQGVHFFDLHQYFETLYAAANSMTDEIAERILILDHRPLSLVRQYIAVAQIQEEEGMEEDYMMVEQLVKDHQVLINNFNSILSRASSLNEEGTIDLMAGLLRQVEKENWKLKSWLNKKSPSEMKVAVNGMAVPNY